MEIVTFVISTACSFCKYQNLSQTQPMTVLSILLRCRMQLVACLGKLRDWKGKSYFKN